MSRAPGRGMSADSLLWRKLAYAGARYGPRPWLKYSPALFGLAFAAALPELRRRVRANLRLIHGQRSMLAEGWDVARTFSAYSHALAEALAGERPEARSARRRIRGEAHLRSALSDRSRGLVILTAHTGAWDAAASVLARDFDLEVAIVMQREADAKAQALQDNVRTQAGVLVIHVGQHPLDVLPLVHHLSAGRVLAIQLDRRPHSARSLEVEFFGRPRAVPEGPFVLAARAGATILPLFCRHVGYFDFEFSATPPIRLPRRPSRPELLAAAQRATWEMERFIRAHPTQWFHFEEPSQP